MNFRFFRFFLEIHEKSQPTIHEGFLQIQKNAFLQKTRFFKIKMQANFNFSKIFLLLKKYLPRFARRATLRASAPPSRPGSRRRVSKPRLFWRHRRSRHFWRRDAGRHACRPVSRARTRARPSGAPSARPTQAYGRPAPAPSARPQRAISRAEPYLSCAGARASAIRPQGQRAATSNPRLARGRARRASRTR